MITDIIILLQYYYYRGNSCDDIHIESSEFQSTTATIFPYHVMILSISWLWLVVYFMSSTDNYTCPHNHTYLQNEMLGFTSEIFCTVMFCILYVCVYMWLLDMCLSTSVCNMCVMSPISEIWLQTDHVRVIFGVSNSCAYGKEWIVLICRLSNSWGHWESLQSCIGDQSEQYASE